MKTRDIFGVGLLAAFLFAAAPHSFGQYNLSREPMQDLERARLSEAYAKQRSHCRNAFGPAKACAQRDVGGQSHGRKLPSLEHDGGAAEENVE